MNLNSLFVKSVATRAQLVNYQTVRWRRPRKPFWLGIAKSKMFVIPEPSRVRTPEEAAVMDSITKHYKTSVKSLLYFMSHENPHLAPEIQGENEALSPSFLRHMSKSMESNASFNEESARRREERMKKAEEEETKKIMEFLELKEEEERKQMEFIEEIVRKEKVLSESFVTRENLDEAIEKCLRNVECFDFAIDLDGNFYHGRDSLLPQSQDSDKQAESSAG